MSNLVVPLGDRKRVGDCQPVPMDFKIRTMIGWNQKHLNRCDNQHSLEAGDNTLRQHVFYASLHVIWQFLLRTNEIQIEREMIWTMSGWCGNVSIRLGQLGIDLDRSFWMSLILLMAVNTVLYVLSCVLTYVSLKLLQALRDMKVMKLKVGNWVNWHL